MYSNCINEQFTIFIGGQECTDYVDIQRPGDNVTVVYNDILVIIPRLNFTCSGKITIIRTTLWFEKERSKHPSIQVWRPASFGSTIYNKTGEVIIKLQSDDHLNSGAFIATTTLTDSIIEVKPGDVVGYYHPSDSRLRIISRRTDGYRVYALSGSHGSVDLNNTFTSNYLQPLIQFTIGKYDFNQAQ